MSDSDLQFLKLMEPNLDVREDVQDGTIGRLSLELCS